MVWTVIESKVKQGIFVITLILVVAVVYLVTNTMNLKNQCRTKDNEIAMLNAAGDHPNITQKPVTTVKVSQKRTVTKSGRTFVDVVPEEPTEIIEISTPEPIGQSGDEYVEVLERTVEYISDQGKEIINSWSKQDDSAEYRYSVGPVAVRDSDGIGAGIMGNINIGKRFAVGMEVSGKSISAGLLYRFGK